MFNQVKIKLVVILFIFFISSCIYSTELYEFWGVWDPGENSVGPFRNVQTTMGLFKSNSDDPIIIDYNNGHNSFIFEQGQKFIITKITGYYPKYFIDVYKYKYTSIKTSRLSISFSNLNKIVFETLYGDIKLGTSSIYAYYSRSPKIDKPVPEDDFESGS